MKTQNILSLAAFKIGTTCLGPGYRAVIWVQGCPFHCSGCISPEWIRPGGKPYQVNAIADLITNDPRVNGITISGGEPMLQAGSLAAVLKLIRKRNIHINVISFTGFLFDQLKSPRMYPKVEEFLSNIDVLIDGQYIAELDDNKGLRGSSNQKIHYLTDRLSGINFENHPRKIEVDFLNGNAFIVGIPPKQFGLAWDHAMGSI
jgi:anaerobic ribonucleoside-triphosphate reductase activating protein